MSHPATTIAPDKLESGYGGLRMTADEFLQIPDDGHNDELIDRVVQMSPRPDLVVEVISQGSRQLVTKKTKRKDYEHFGVRESWMIDPEHESMMFFRLQDGEFVEVPPRGDQFSSLAVAGFVLDLHLVREQFKPW